MEASEVITRLSLDRFARVIAGQLERASSVSEGCRNECERWYQDQRFREDLLADRAAQDKTIATIERLISWHSEQFGE